MPLLTSVMTWRGFSFWGDRSLGNNSWCTFFKVTHKENWISQCHLYWSAKNMLMYTIQYHISITVLPSKWTFLTLDECLVWCFDQVRSSIFFYISISCTIHDEVGLFLYRSNCFLKPKKPKLVQLMFKPTDRGKNEI